MTELCAMEIGSDGCARLSGPLTVRTTPALYRAADHPFRNQGGALSIDLSGITTADSAGLALLLEWQAQKYTGDGKLPIHNAPPSLLSLARLCEADELLEISGRGG